MGVRRLCGRIRARKMSTPNEVPRVPKKCPIIAHLVHDSLYCLELSEATMNVQSSSTIEFTDEEPKSALSEVLEALRHPDGPGAGIKALGFLWEKNSAARYRRFYYEQILQRTADSAISARAPVSNPGAAIAEMLCSDEFINGSVGTLANEYRHLKRMIYVHIPKSGGTTVMNAFIDDPRHAIVYMPRAIFE